MLVLYMRDKQSERVEIRELSVQPCCLLNPLAIRERDNHGRKIYTLSAVPRGLNVGSCWE